MGPQRVSPPQECTLSLYSNMGYLPSVRHTEDTWQDSLAGGGEIDRAQRQLTSRPPSDVLSATISPPRSDAPTNCEFAKTRLAV